jgi:dTDP-4-dehydrorhamnose 3,5-epimerase
VGFTFRPTAGLPEVILVVPSVATDARGWFMESYRRSLFAEHGIPADFVQDNHSRSTQLGTVRGLHYQEDPMAQGKLVRCPLGKIFDVAVDIRAGSPTFGRWVGEILSEEKRHLLWVPPGFAHGFCTLSEVADVLYKVTAEYSATHERGIHWNDPQIGIRWPVADPVLSDKDAQAPLLAEAGKRPLQPYGPSVT